MKFSKLSLLLLIIFAYLGQAGSKSKQKEFTLRFKHNPSSCQHLATNIALEIQFRKKSEEPSEVGQNIEDMFKSKENLYREAVTNEIQELDCKCSWYVHFDSKYDQLTMLGVKNNDEIYAISIGNVHKSTNKRDVRKVTKPNIVFPTWRGGEVIRFSPHHFIAFVTGELKFFVNIDGIDNDSSRISVYAEKLFNDINDQMIFQEDQELMNLHKQKFVNARRKK